MNPPPESELSFPPSIPSFSDIPSFKIGKGSFGANEEGQLIVMMENENPLDLQLNDVILKVNGEVVDVNNLMPLYSLVMVSDANREVTVTVDRGDKEVKLQAKPVMEEITIDYFIFGQNPDNYTPEQVEMREDLLQIND